MQKIIAPPVPGTNTPLRNLFGYIRDLYNSAEPVYRFSEEPNNKKTLHVNFWELSNVLEMDRLFRKKTNRSFSPDSDNNTVLLRLKRTGIHELVKPAALEEWLVITETQGYMPTLSVKTSLERNNIAFDKSPQRQQSFNRYKKEVEKNNSAENVPVPDILQGWIKTEKVNDTLVVEKKETGTEKEQFEDNKERVLKYNKYEKYFSDYYKDNWDAIRINRLYDALHQLHYELKGSDSKKLYLSFGLVSGKIGGIHYQNFLFHVPLTLSLKNQEIKIEYDTFANKIFCEQHFSELLEEHFKSESLYSVEQKRKEVLQNMDYFNSQALEFFLDDAFIKTNFYETALRITGIFSQVRKVFFSGDLLDYTFYPHTDQQQIMLSFSPIIQTRYVATPIAVSKDATHIIQKINELEANRELGLIPDFFKKMFAISDSAAHQNGHSVNKTDYHAAVIHQHTSAPERFLFPLPYNEEQLTIAKQLSTQDAVTVKGPPGTGKSHTIANLISHFVAQGKSLLVISHNAKALTVLKDKLPTQIQDLAISLVNENKGNETLKASVNSIVGHLARQYDETSIQRMEAELEQLEQQCNSVKENIYNAIRANTQQITLKNPVTQSETAATAFEWARIFNALNKPAVLQDKINYSTNTDGLPEKILLFIKNTTGFAASDFNLVQYDFQPDEQLLSGTEFRKLESRIQELLKNINPADYANVDPHAYDEPLSRTVGELFDKINALPQLSIAPQLIKHSNFNRALLKRLLQENQAQRRQINTWNEQLLNYQFELNSIKDTDPDILHKQIADLIGRFENNRTLGFVAKKILGKELKRFFECKINSISTNELGHFKILEVFIHRNKKVKQLAITFSNYFGSFGINYLTDVQSVLNELDFIDGLFDTQDRLNQLLEEKKLPTLKYGSNDFTYRLEYLKKLNDYRGYTEAIDALQTHKKKIIDQVRPHPLIAQMATAIEQTDRVQYEQLLETYQQQRNKKEAVLAVNQLFDELVMFIPQTAKKLKAAIINQAEMPHCTIEELESDLFYIKIESFLRHITAQTSDTALLFEKLQNAKANIENKVAEVVAYRSWYYKTRQVDDKQKSALNAWLNDLINIGKGYGKNTARNIQSAIQNMQIAKGAVPIWIMQQESAITFFPDVTPGQFDLLIIDEASQCDISSLNLVFRCKKSIIVGDENQTSVSIDSLEFPMEKTSQVLDRYLISHPFKQQFNVNNKNNSIYTLSGVIYPNIVVLKEHFRCLPEIIGFSNTHIYNRDIIPLKTATHRQFGEPVEIQYVADDVSDESKPQIAETAIRIMENYIVAFEKGALKQLPTMGIITLDSSNIKHQNLLIRKIAGSELVKKYEDRLALLLGTSREFQGDERDVMILTITASHSQTEKGEIRPPRAVTGEEFMRIYNVAASRAKEKSILLHSIHSEAIPLINPDCYRKKLLDYYITAQIKPTAISNTLTHLIRQTDATSGNLEKEVCEWLYNNGFAENIFPQFKVGHYKIDFGIIRNNKKLAIECDGVHSGNGTDKIKDDINRQLILERAGWRFFRVQSTEWFYNREQTGKKLVEWVAQHTQED
jgi:very-short-patch-repair endonuclease